MSSRRDRSSTALRPLALSQGLLSRADGSAQFSFGNVAVLGSVTGPAEVRIRDELVDRATLEINVRPLRGQGGPGIKAIEATLTSLLTPLILLHLYPRALLQLTLQTVSSPSTAFSIPTSTDPLLNAGKGKGKAIPPPPRGVAIAASERAATINAAMMALVDAGVQCRGMLVAVAVAFLPSRTNASQTADEAEEEEMILDPSPAEEDQATSTHVFAFLFGVGVGGTEGTCVSIDAVGTFTEDQLYDAQDLAQSAAQTVLAFIRRSVETKYGAESGPAPAITRPQQAEVEEKPMVEGSSAEEDDDEDDDKVMIDA
ncbi:hypothetical protein JCM10908_001796 [Rhodotorula pacifica]|uniref:exosome non-catalytic core subunit RRP46 n=1 Tax=Rhodotorula pacifica TaxID=1495444 RepID=UPI00316D8471